MQTDIFVKRRNDNLIFFGVLAALTLGSAIITHFDVLKGFTSVGKAFVWGLSNFYPDAHSLTNLPDIAAETMGNHFDVGRVDDGRRGFRRDAGDDAGSRTTRINTLFSVIARGLASVFRNIPLVAWAMILMLAFSQSLLTGYLALFFGSLGFLTRAFIETVDEASIHAVEALKATGASYASIILQAVLPSSLPQMISWLLFMIDTNIRDATLVGLLTGTGVGFSFDLYYKSMNFHAASLVVILIVVTIIGIETLSNSVRRIIL